MSDIHAGLITLLEDAAQRLRDAVLPSEIAAGMASLAEQVRQPCVVAVVGRVKAGKSTFINTLLGQDLAQVGATETTATINYFRYGRPDPQRPVRCHWRSGQITNESREFLDSLQGNDLATLQRAEGIDHLEYHLLNSYLERFTLVDTPGTGAAVAEHQNRTAEWMNLYGQLRERHDQETQRLGNNADAIIYLLGEVARSTDEAFLEAFRQVTQGRSRALNAIGVMAKIDLQPEVLRRRTELAAKVAGKLKDNLNTVVPVSAGVRRALDRLLAKDPEGLQPLLELVRSVPAPTLDKMLDSEDLFLDPDLPKCPVPVEQRVALLDSLDMQWQVFKTIAQLAADPQLDAVAVHARANELSGFELLKETLERHFLRRSQTLRSYRIINDASQLLSVVRYQHLPEFRRQDKARQDRFLNFIRNAGGDPAVAHELEAMVVERFSARAGLESVVRDLERRFALLFHQLEEDNEDFEALQQMEAHPDLFSPDEQEQLRTLLGLYGLELDRRLLPSQLNEDYVDRQQRRWREMKMLDRNDVRRQVAGRAVARYGLILEELLRNSSAAPA